MENEKINIKINKSEDTKITSDAPNAKFIVIDNNDGDLPILLEGDN